MDLYFIRHGETVFNVEKRYYGKANPPLTDKGISQMKERAAELSHIKVAGIITSELERTKKSAQIICEMNGWSTALIQPCQALDEMDFGKWEGLTANEVAAADPEAWANFMKEPLTIHPTAGESFNGFKERVLTGFEEIIKAGHPTDTLLFVGHLGVLRLIIHTYFEPETDYFDIDFSRHALKHYTIGEEKWDKLF